MKKKTSFTLTPTAIDLIRRLTDKLGVSQAAIVEMAVRKLARDEDVQAHGREDEH